MKPTSIIFLIISVMLALVGVLLCFTASNMANDQGIALFSQTGDADSNYSAKKDFDGDSIRKIVITMSEVDVNVYGGAESNYIELVNFPDGTYDLSVSKSTLQLSDKTAITNIIDVDNLKINFNGFRDYLHYFKYKDKPRTVNLYFTDSAEAIILSISSEADITLQDLRLDCDYKLNVTDGDVSVSNVKTISSLSIESTVDSKVSIVSTTVNDLRIDGVTAYASMRSSGFTRSMYVNIKSGSVDYDRIEDDFVGFNLYLKAGTGSISYFNKIKSGEYSEQNYVDIDSDEDNSEEDENSDDGNEDENTDSTPDTTATDEPSVSPVTGVDAYSVTIILGEGNIKIY